jgi:chromosome segregation ATPase
MIDLRHHHQNLEEFCDSISDSFLPLEEECCDTCVSRNLSLDFSSNLHKLLQYKDKRLEKQKENDQNIIRRLENKIQELSNTIVEQKAENVTLREKICSLSKSLSNSSHIQEEMKYDIENLQRKFYHYALLALKLQLGIENISIADMIEAAIEEKVKECDLSCWLLKKLETQNIISRTVSLFSNQ